jgi:uncharacterized heparinase superfamily protein
LTGLLVHTGRLWRTVRWLKPVQVWGRLRVVLPRGRADASPASARRPISGRWTPPPAREPSLSGPSRLNLLGVERDLRDVGWDDPRMPLLWRYHQHYFDDLNSADAAGRRGWHRDLIDRWIAENAPGRATAFAPYPVSLRLVNWIKWFLGGVEPTAAWLDSLALQARWLSRHVEWHLLGNHLFANAKALVFAGLYFQDREAEAWLARGLSILRTEVNEQILSDGGHFERSPTYHALALEDVLDLVNVGAALAPPGSAARQLEPLMRQKAEGMLHWMRCLQHPDGALARFNDGAPGAPACEELERYARMLGVTAPAPEERETGPGAPAFTVLQPSGYIRARSGQAVALIDVAPVGPDYIPGHAHADTLSFELSLGGRQVVVNRGTSVYGTGERRLYERGTAAHSTVQLGDENSSEVWAGFRVGRRARPGPVQIDDTRIACSHDGYGHLPRRPRHSRTWAFDGRELRVEDAVEPGVDVPAYARFHLAPGLDVRPAGDRPRSWRIVEGPSTLAKVVVDAGEVELEDSLHAERFGLLTPARTVVVRLTGGRAATRWSW